MLTHAENRWTGEQREITTRLVFRDDLGGYGITKSIQLVWSMSTGNKGDSFLSDERDISDSAITHIVAQWQ